MKAKKLLYLFAFGAIAASGCCFPSLPLCNECITNGLIALGTLIGAFNGTGV